MFSLILWCLEVSSGLSRCLYVEVSTLAMEHMTNGPLTFASPDRSECRIPDLPLTMFIIFERLYLSL